MLHEVTDDDAAAGADLPDGEYAIVELLGHRTLVGRIAEVERFGSKLLQVEPLFDGRLLEPVYHHGAALYGLTPCSKLVAAKHQPRRDYSLPAPVRARLDRPALPAPAVADPGDDDGAALRQAQDDREES